MMCDRSSLKNQKEAMSKMCEIRSLARKIKLDVQSALKSSVGGGFVFAVVWWFISDRGLSVSPRWTGACYIEQASFKLMHLTPECW